MKSRYIIPSIIFALCLLHIATIHATSVLSVPQGGTGTSTAPTSGQILIGTNGGVYTFIASSSLGSGGGGGSGSITTSSPITVNGFAYWTGASTIGSTSTPLLTVSASGTLIQIGSISANGAITLGVDPNLANYNNGTAKFITQANVSTTIGSVTSSTFQIGAGLSVSTTGTISNTAVLTSPISTSSAVTKNNWTYWSGTNTIDSTSSQPILSVNASGTIIQIGSISATGTISIGVSQNLSTYNNNAGFLTGNQTITLTGPITGSGATTIATTCANCATGGVDVGTTSTVTHAGLTATNVTSTAHSTLTAASSTNIDATGYVKVNGVKVVTSSVTSALLSADTGGGIGGYAGTGPCSANTFMTTVSAAGAQTCGGVTFPITTSTPVTKNQWAYWSGLNTLDSTSSQPVLTVNSSGTIIQIGSISATGTISIGLSQNLSRYTNDAGFLTTTTTINGTQGATFSLIGDGIDVTSTVSAGTTTFSLINQGVGDGNYFLTNTASDLASNKVASDTPQSLLASTTVASLSNGTTSLQSWSTASSVPSVSFLPPGIINVHIAAAQTAGTKPTQLFSQVTEVSATGTVLGVVGTSPSSSVLTGTLTEYDLDFTIATPYTMASTASRLQTTVYSSVSGLLVAPTVQLYYGGTSGDSRLEIPASTVDVTNFVPYTGAIKALNIGSNNFTTTGLTSLTSVSSTNITATGNIAASSSYITNVSSTNITAQNIFDNAGNKYSTSTPAASGVTNYFNYHLTPYNSNFPGTNFANTGRYTQGSVDSIDMGFLNFNPSTTTVSKWTFMINTTTSAMTSCTFNWGAHTTSTTASASSTGFTVYAYSLTASSSMDQLLSNFVVGNVTSTFATSSPAAASSTPPLYFTISTGTQQFVAGQETIVEVKHPNTDPFGGNLWVPDIDLTCK